MTMRLSYGVDHVGRDGDKIIDGEPAIDLSKQPISPAAPHASASPRQIQLPQAWRPYPPWIGQFRRSTMLPLSLRT
jgi:hypothetical protein